MAENTVGWVGQETTPWNCSWGGQWCMLMKKKEMKERKRESDKQKETSIHMDRYGWIGENEKEKHRVSTSMVDDEFSNFSGFLFHFLVQTAKLLDPVGSQFLPKLICMKAKLLYPLERPKISKWRSCTLLYTKSHQYKIWRLEGVQEVNHDWDEWEILTLIISDGYVRLSIVSETIPGYFSQRSFSLRLSPLLGWAVKILWRRLFVSSTH